MRRDFVLAAGAVACLAALALPAKAQDAYPTKPIRLIVPFPPAGGTDVLSGAISSAIEEDGNTPLGGTPAQFADFIRQDHAKWGAAVRDAGIKLD